MPRSKPVISKEFAAIVRTIMNKLKELAYSDEDLADVQRLHARIGLLVSVLGEEALISNAYAYILSYRTEILSRNEKFFTCMDTRAVYTKTTGQKITNDNMYIFDIVDMAQQAYMDSDDAERDEIYSYVSRMLTCSAEYALLL